MKKKILFSLLVLFSLTACGKTEVPKEPEKKYICKEISSLIAEYDNDSITVKQLKSGVSTKYDEVCKNDNTEECKYIFDQVINNTDKSVNMEANCNIYSDQEMIDNCIKTGEKFDYLEPMIKASQDSVVFNVKEKCVLVSD